MPSEVRAAKEIMNQPFCGTKEKLFIFKKLCRAVCHRNISSYAIEISAHFKVSLRWRNYHYSNGEGYRTQRG